MGYEKYNYHYGAVGVNPGYTDVEKEKRSVNTNVNLIIQSGIECVKRNEQTQNLTTLFIYPCDQDLNLAQGSLVSVAPLNPPGSQWSNYGDPARF